MIITITIKILQENVRATADKFSIVNDVNGEIDAF